MQSKGHLESKAHKDRAYVAYFENRTNICMHLCMLPLSSLVLLIPMFLHRRCMRIRVIAKNLQGPDHVFPCAKNIRPCSILNAIRPGYVPFQDPSQRTTNTHLPKPCQRASPNLGSRLPSPKDQFRCGAGGNIPSVFLLDVLIGLLYAGPLFLSRPPHLIGNPRELN